MHRKQFDALASSFSLSEKSIVGELTPFGEFTSDHDEHSQTDILASGLNPCSRLPIPADSGIWKQVAHHSGATALDSHEVPCI